MDRNRKRAERTRPGADEVAAALRERGIDPKQAAPLRLTFASAAQTRAVVEAEVPSILIPYFTLSGEPLRERVDGLQFVRAKLLAPYRVGKEKRDRKYLQPAGTRAHLYLPPLADWQALAADPKQQIAITEGELKSAALTLHGLPTIGLGGVWSWREQGDDDAGSVATPELQLVNWARRTVFLVFDSDVYDNPQVLAARTALMRHLTRLGAVVRIVDVPRLPNALKTGIDDYLVAQPQPKAALRNLINAADAPLEFRPHTSEELSKMKLSKTTHQVRNLVAPGLNILAGNPKAGKTLLAYELAHALADARVETFGGAKIERHGDVLYLDYELNDEQIQERRTRAEFSATPRLAHEYNRKDHAVPTGDDALRAIERWLEQAPEPVAVVIDTMEHFFIGGDPRLRELNSYERDVARLAPLHRLGLNRNVAIVVVHHLNKKGDLMGSQGIPGTCSIVLRLDRPDFTQPEATIKVQSRVGPGGEYALELQSNGTWKWIGDASVAAVARARSDVLDALQSASDAGMTPSEVQNVCGTKRATTYRALHALRAAGLAHTNGRGWYVTEAGRGKKEK